jgi:hypothetical protein
MRAILCVVTTTLLFSGCSAKADFSAAKQAVDTFHQRMSAGDYDVIYDSSTNTFRGTGSREQFQEFLKRVTQKMGQCTDATQKQWRMNTTTNGTFVQLSYVRKCANGDLHELFAWKMENGKALLNGYNANSPILR